MINAFVAGRGPLPYGDGSRPSSTNAADGTNYMEGLGTAYSGDSLAINVDTIAIGPRSVVSEVGKSGFLHLGRAALARPHGAGADREFDVRRSGGQFPLVSSRRLFGRWDNRELSEALV